MSPYLITTGIAKKYQLFSFTFDILFQYIINYRINVFINIFEEEWEAIFNGHLQLLQEVRVIEGAHLEWRQYMKNKKYKN